MLHKGDKITMKAQIGTYNHIGELLYVTDARDNGDFCYASDDGTVEGLASKDMFDKYFEMYGDYTDRIKKRIEDDKKQVESEKPKKNTVTQDMIDEIIDNSELIIDTLFDKCTMVACKLPNGFVIVETSACVDPANYDEDLGVENCMCAIEDKIWELEGYKLQENLASDNADNVNDNVVDTDCANCEFRDECNSESYDDYDDYDDDYDDDYYDDYYRDMDKKYVDFLTYLDDAFDSHMHGI